MNPSIISSSSILRDLIVNPNTIDQNLLCLICQELVVDPKECSQCQNLFCSECITQWLEKRKSCPYNCSKEIELKNPHRIVKNQISQIEVKCVNKGCDLQMQIQNIDSHLQQCEYQEKQCQFADCDFKDIQKQIKHHEQICEHRVQNCQKCDATYKVNQEHDCLVHLLQKLKLQEANFQAYQKTTDQVIMDLVSRLTKLEDSQKGPKKPKCFQGHELKWIYPKQGIQCESCKYANENIRYVCEICRVGYCQRCKLPEFNGNICPANHILQFTQKPSFGLKCDFCRLNIYSKHDSVYSDRSCDFDICNSCFQKFKLLK
ncbi:unnamed protein product (macronuclear) [Paramecium tetraurelia]|uniref:RING-type domain-containing protein n=1 Tax=Paramecium tetraurelia TaxID=5888 RepID=A0BTB6_PARTE|nr:uncharacterized protein GSPATT00032015001 [Paramecium tetraurelia]CAK61783.1 unnamed protein product [Paramecium tetraurelia]|eukprot:XP_001429181.1 hypothetical protein (macronuclear) [Paramecium tetraurelia strain d4-2]